MTFSDIFSELLSSLSLTEAHAEAPPADEDSEDKGEEEGEGEDKSEDGGEEEGGEGGGDDEEEQEEEEEEEEDEDEPVDIKPKLEEGMLNVTSLQSEILVFRGINGSCSISDVSLYPPHLHVSSQSCLLPFNTKSIGMYHNLQKVLSRRRDTWADLR